jgi:hypothetical protein
MALMLISYFIFHIWRRSRRERDSSGTTERMNAKRECVKVMERPRSSPEGHSPTRAPKGREAARPNY